MGTHSNIILKLRNTDVNKTFKSTCGLKVTPNGKEYLSVYCHNDGYPEGVGEDLQRMINKTHKTYEQILNYILEGDRSTTKLSYHEWRGEVCPPRPHEIAESDPWISFIYLIEEDENGNLNLSIKNVFEDDDFTLLENYNY